MHKKTELYTFESKSTITLQFNHDAIQSVMRKSDPFALEFEYTQAMMAFLPLYEQISSVLLIGLGGGSLSKFCYQQLPSSQITTVEISAEVLSYRQLFQVPANNKRFKVLEADGTVYIQDKVNAYQVILLDAYDGEGMPGAFNETFYQHCYQALHEQGVLVVNLWRKDIHFRRNLHRIHHCFLTKTISLKCQSGNEIIFAFKNPQLAEFDEVWQRALQWQQKTRINFPQFLEDMIFSLKNTWFYNGRAN